MRFQICRIQTKLSQERGCFLQEITEKILWSFKTGKLTKSLQEKSSEELIKVNTRAQKEKWRVRSIANSQKCWEIHERFQGIPKKQYESFLKNQKRALDLRADKHRVKG